MQDLSKIDFSKCKLPAWDEYALEASCGPELNTVSVSIRNGMRLAKKRFSGEWSQYASGTFDELRALEAICRQVDAFIESELAKQTSESVAPECSGNRVKREDAPDHDSMPWRNCGRDEAMRNAPLSQVTGGPSNFWYRCDTVNVGVLTWGNSEFRTLAKRDEPEWRPCSKEFAMANPEVSQARVHPFDDDGRDWFSLDTFAFNSPPYLYEFRTKALLQQQPDHIDTRNPGRTYSARGDADSEREWFESVIRDIQTAPGDVTRVFYAVSKRPKADSGAK